MLAERTGRLAVQGLSRTYTLGPMWPNYGAYFQVASINHNVEPVPKLWADYVEGNLLPGFSKFDSGETFWPAVMPDGEGERALSQNLTNYLNIGTRYVVTNAGQSLVATTLLRTAEPGGEPVSPRLRTLLVALERCHVIAEDQAKPALERFLAKTIWNMSNSIRGVYSSDARRDGDHAEVLDTDSIILFGGQSATVNVGAPSNAGSPITSVGTKIGNSGAKADGDLVIEICAGGVCSSGQRSLADSAADVVFQVTLDKPLNAPTGAPLRLTFTHREGLCPVSLRAGAALEEQPQQIQGPNGVLPGRALPLTFEYGMALSGTRKVYADGVLDIWELPNPAPYFQVIQGGPCTLSAMQRESVTVDCAAPATLVRRELYMPGWGVKVNSSAAATVQQEGIFQSVALAAGHNQVRYHFAPPYVNFGWAASIIGMAGLILQVILLGRLRQAEAERQFMRVTEK